MAKLKSEYSELKLDLWGCPCVVAYGGLHGAVKNLFLDSDEENVILNYDVNSYYPSIMIENGYLSRNVADPLLFEEAYHARMKAKVEGDTKTNNALKLVLNTTYGASNNQYNDLFDPLMAHSVCISGQLYLIELINRLGHALPDLLLIQANTDGIMFRIPRVDVPEVRKIIADWEKRTKFTMEEDVITQVRQRDVNNYCIRMKNGKIKAKGGALSNWKGGNFQNSTLAIVCKAMVLNLLDDIPVEETINGCDDIFMFQMIAKAGGTYEKVVHATEVGDIDINRTNRVYACANKNTGTVYKIKSNGRRDKLASAPEHSIIDNEGNLTIDKIDKHWYIVLCNERLTKFRGIKAPRKTKTKKGKTKMANDEELIVIDEDEVLEVTVPVKATRKPRKKAVEETAKEEIVAETKEEEVVEKTYPSFKFKMFQLSMDIVEDAKKFIEDGYNSNQSYSYVKAQQYKTLLRNCLIKNRLMGKLDDAVADVLPVLKSDKMVLTSYYGTYTIMDVDSDEKQVYMLRGQGSDNMDKGLSKAKTLAIKDFVKANFGISDVEDDVEGDVAPVATSPDKAVKKAGKKFVTPAMVRQTADEVSKGSTTEASPSAVDKLKANIELIQSIEGSETYGQTTLDKLDELTDTKATVNMTKVRLKLAELGLEEV